MTSRDLRMCTDPREELRIETRVTSVIFQGSQKIEASKAPTKRSVRLSMAVVSRLMMRSNSPILFNALRRTLCVVGSESESATASTMGCKSRGVEKVEDGEKERRQVQWVFLGCPGVGKGTYASRLSSLLGVPHISTGDLLREELASSGPLASKLSEIVNQGKLVSDEIIINLLSKRLEAGESKGEVGFILDGFPRTIRQAEILEGVTDIDLVINLKLREDILVAKCLGRRICSECGGNYNVACIDIKAENGDQGIYMAPLLPPPGCETKLITRADDKEEIVKKRLQVYNEQSQPLEDFYRRRGKLLEFDLPGGIPESWTKLLQALNLSHLDDKQSAAA